MSAAESALDGGERALARQLVTLMLSRVHPRAAGSAVAAIAWRNGLAKLGLSVPLFVVHDLGVLLSRPEERRSFLERSPGDLEVKPVSVLRYDRFLRALAESESLEALGSTFMRDEVIAVLLARLLGEACQRWSARAPDVASDRTPLPLMSPLHSADPASLAQGGNPEWALSFLPALLDQEAAILARLDQIDLGPIRLLGLFPPGALPPDLAELYQFLGATGSGDVVDFCLQLLPSLLETKRQSAAQTFAVDGYASIERRGNPDALLPSELAHDPEVFSVKAVSDELLYYSHERPHEGARRVHGVLVDASASMRGAREVFARGLAIALVKKLALIGVEVWLRFFDSRLHRKIEAATLGGHDLPYVLCFRSERGRNYARVFGDLVAELERERTRGQRDLALTFITHAECHIPIDTVEALARRAALYGVFVLPARPLALDYLLLLHSHHTVTAESMVQPAGKRRRALEIVADVVTGQRSSFR